MGLLDEVVVKALQVFVKKSKNMWRHALNNILRVIISELNNCNGYDDPLFTCAFNERSEQIIIVHVEQFEKLINMDNIQKILENHSCVSNKLTELRALVTATGMIHTF
jgi:hypothetical protein